MKFCVISPTAGLDLFSTRSKTHLLLPHIRHKEYIEFYRRRRKAGDFLILDNGAYEGQMVGTNRLKQRITLYEPQCVVCPDAYLKDWKITWNLTQKFLNDIYNCCYDTCEFMGIPQSTPGDIQGWYKCCREMMQDERIKWIGIPRNLFTHFGRDPRLRALIAVIIKDVKPDIKIHAFGMGDGSLEELQALAECGAVESCDSSAPVWRGWSDVWLGDHSYWDIHGTPVDFSAKLPIDISTIERNLKEVFNICLG